MLTAIDPSYTTAGTETAKKSNRSAGDDFESVFTFTLKEGERIEDHLKGATSTTRKDYPTIADYARDPENCQLWSREQFRSFFAECLEMDEQIVQAELAAQKKAAATPSV